jgi:hypothetical protein
MTSAARESNALLDRAERSGPGNGRVDAIATTCTDVAGTGSTALTTVTVPHDQGGGGGKS